MKTINLPVLLAGLFVGLGAGSAMAQVASSYDGTWKATWQGAARPLEATVVVNGAGGSWKTFSSNSSNPCVGREAPIVVTAASDQGLSFTANFSSVIPSCENFDVTLKREGETLKGTRGRFPVELVRK